MTEYILNFIKDNFGLSFVIGLLLIAGFIFLVIWTVRMYFKIKVVDSLPCKEHQSSINDISKLMAKIDSYMDKLPCDEHKAKMDDVTTLITKMDDLPCRERKSTLDKHDDKFEQWIDRQENLDKSIVQINTKLEFMLKNVEMLSNNLMRLQSADTFSLKKSPRKLNEQGLDIFEKIKGAQFLEENKAFFFAKIDELKPQTRLDVENASNFVCHTTTGEDMFNSIKDFVYNYPSMKIEDKNGDLKPYDLTLGDVCFIISLPLRDMYLEAHPEFT